MRSFLPKNALSNPPLPPFSKGGTGGLFSFFLFIIIVFYSDMFRLSAAFAEDATGTNQQVVPSENSNDNKQPSITRNPFISAPYGRMGRAPAGTGTNTDTGNVKRDRGDVPLKSLRLRGI